jgi:integrase
MSYRFKFSSQTITKDQARFGFANADKASGYWKAAWFSADKANRIARGDSPANPRQIASYRCAYRLLRDDQGNKYPIDEVSSAFIIKEARKRSDEQIKLILNQMEEDAIEPWVKARGRSIQEVWGEWRSALQADNPHEAATTVKGYERVLIFMTQNHPHIKTLADLTHGIRTKIRERNNSLISDYTDRPYAHNYLKKTEATFCRFTEWCVARRYIDPNIDLGTDSTRKGDPKETGRVNGATEFSNSIELLDFADYIEATPVDKARSERQRKLWAKRFIFMGFTGLRCKEALALRWSDIDMSANSITVSAEIAKTSKERVVGLLPQAKAALEQMRVLSKRVPASDGLVFDGISYTLLWDCFNRWIKGFTYGSNDHRTPHSLRSFFVNYLIKEQDQPLRVVAMWSGDTWQVLEKHYANLNDQEMSRKALENITNASSQASSPTVIRQA